MLDHAYTNTSWWTWTVMMTSRCGGHETMIAYTGFTRWTSTSGCASGLLTTLGGIEVQSKRDAPI